MYIIIMVVHVFPSLFYCPFVCTCTMCVHVLVLVMLVIDI